MTKTETRSVDSASRRALIEAASEFNRGNYFEAHEVLEEQLEELPDELWNLFLGLIQISVGYHKLGQGLLTGASRMLGIGLQKIEGLDSSSSELRLDPLRERAGADRDALESHTFDADAFRANPPRLQPLPRER